MNRSIVRVRDAIGLGKSFEDDKDGRDSSLAELVHPISPVEQNQLSQVVPRGIKKSMSLSVCRNCVFLHPITHFDSWWKTSVPVECVRKSPTTTHNFTPSDHGNSATQASSSSKPAAPKNSIHKSSTHFTPPGGIPLQCHLPTIPGPLKLHEDAPSFIVYFEDYNKFGRK